MQTLLYMPVYKVHSKKNLTILWSAIGVKKKYARTFSVVSSYNMRNESANSKRERVSLVVNSLFNRGVQHIL